MFSTLLILDQVSWLGLLDLRPILVFLGLVTARESATGDTFMTCAFESKSMHLWHLTQHGNTYIFVLKTIAVHAAASL